MNSLSKLIGACAALGLVGLGSYGVHVYNSTKNAGQKQLDKIASMEEELTAAKRQYEDSIEQKNQAIAEQEKTIAQQTTTIKQSEKTIAKQGNEIEKLSADVRFLSVSTRMATIKALAKEDIHIFDEAGERKSIRWRVRFQEYDPNGNPFGDELEGFVIGEELKAEFLTVEWDYSHPDFKGDIEFLRRPTLVLIRRLYGTDEAPNATSFVIDEKGKLPAIYSYARGDSELSEFEQLIMNEFWEIANDPNRQSQKGIRFIGSSTPGIKLREGSVYRLEIRESGAPKIKAIGQPSTDDTNNSS